MFNDNRNQPFTLVRCLLLLSTLLLVNPLQARNDDFQQPIDVKADRSEYNEKEGLQSLSGNVFISQGTMKIRADSITVKLDSQNRLSVIEGKGSPIIFEQENELGELVEGRCSRIRYDAVKGVLTLSGNATLTEPKQRLSSDKIVFNSITQTVIAEGGKSGQVSITIQPPTQNK